ncbi:hypothetical protein [Sulfurimonas sp.]|uniref:hypothetical protein n=1 Tax=Sulfurimonas sp. TaxID=2022749 RepID=UPI002B48CD2D|nr:hypothetical protein [Sulfurimonas sp.]
MNLQKYKNKTILLFGKSRAFSSDEFKAQMHFHKINIIDEFNEDIALIVDGKMMTPYEQNESENLYKESKYVFMDIDVLERELAKIIDGDTLLMSLKLSHDKDRLKDFLTNSMITDEIFFKLLKMYNWNKEDFFDNDNNRDVSAAFISRFYENIERNHNVQYATTGFIHLVAQAKNKTLLQVISNLEPLIFHPRLKCAIAMNVFSDLEMQKIFLKSGGERILEALSFNKRLDATLVKEFLNDEVLANNMALTITLNEDLFKLLKEYKTSIAKNESLSFKMQKQLLNLEESDVDFALGQNNALDISIIKKLLQNDDEKIISALYENTSTPQEILQVAYQDEKNHASLAKNENTPIDILYQLQLDARYERSVKTNAGYGKHIQSENLGWLV